MPGNAAAIEPLARAGVPGFKCFLIHSGIDGFAWVDEADLRLALAQATRNGPSVAGARRNRRARGRGNEEFE